MLFVALLKIRPDAPSMAESVARRAQYQPPAGTRARGGVLAATQRPHDHRDSGGRYVQPLMAIRAFWGDVFDITFIPAMTLKEGQPQHRLWRQ